MTLSPHVIVIGAGILGASIAFALCQRGARVTVLDRGPLGGRASANSFGWINASFAESDAYFDLRQAAVTAFQSLCRNPDLSGPVKWGGTLWWEDEGEAFDTQYAVLRRRGYEAEMLDKSAISTLCPPLLSPPEQAIFTPNEGAAEASVLARRLLALAGQRGAHLISGCRVERVLDQGRGVLTSVGRLNCDHVVVATGAVTPDILNSIGLSITVHEKPGLILRTEPMEQVLDQIIMTPDVHFRQAASGAFVMGEIFSGDLAAGVDVPKLAHDIHARVERRVSFDLPPLAQICLGQRPVPVDGFPIIDTRDALSVAVMHSGVTLGPLVGNLLADEILKGVQSPLLADFRLDRPKF